MSDYKKIYKDAYELASKNLYDKSMDYKARKDYVAMLHRANDRLKNTDITESDYWKKIVSNAQMKALNDFKKACHKKGFTILGRKIKIQKVSTT